MGVVENGMRMGNREVIAREIKAHGNIVLRYQIGILLLDGCDAVNDFTRALSEAVQQYAKGMGEELAETYGALTRSERAGFQARNLGFSASLLYDDKTYISVLYHFILRDKRTVLCQRRLAATFDAKSGRACSPAEFLGKGKKAPSSSFYLTENGPVFLNDL